MQGWGAKTIVLEKVVSQKVDAACEKFHRFEDSFNALQWLLARKQDIGITKIADEKSHTVYVQDGDPIAGTPSIWVLFSDTANEVKIWDINVIENGTEAD